MARLGAISVAGKSGTQYRFTAYPLGTTFKKGLGAVLVATRRRQVKRNGAFKHRRMVLDQTDDVSQFLARETRPLADHGVNCICVHVETDQAARLRIQEDLIPRLPSGD